MDLATIEITPEEATAKLREYRQAVRKERHAEDEALRRAYAAAVNGTPIIRLTEVIERGGVDEQGRPNLAIIRAGTTECWLRTENTYRPGEGAFVFCDRPMPDDRGALVGQQAVRVRSPLATKHIWNYRTMVPLVPPEHRPQRYALDRCHILWEVEEWSLVPPKDPALLRHIRGDLWAVLSVWDLTELERAVLSERR